MTNTIRTPIIFSLESFIEDDIDPTIPLPSQVTPDNELSLITKPIYLANRYYLIIKPPAEIRNDIDYIPKPFTYYIPWEGIYKNQVRLGLIPTIGWGEGSCYTVEYWEWTPRILPKIYKKTPIKHKLLKTEYWLIPHPIGRFLINYNYIDATKLKATSLSLTSTGNPISLINYNDVLVTTTINSTSTNYSIAPTIATNTSLIQRAVNYKKTTDLLLTTTIPSGSLFTLEYIKPLTIKQILFKNSMHPQGIYINNSSFVQNTALSF